MTAVEWDLAVVGAGPAGAAAALAALHAQPRAKVLLLDAATFPRDKVCGDGIAPHALDVLSGLGVDTARLVAGTEPITRLRLRAPGGAEAARATPRPMHVVARRAFDDRLVHAACRAGATLVRHRVRTLRSGADGVVLDDSFSARVVIGADGAESVVRRSVGARPARGGTVAIALRGYADVHDWPPGEQLLIMTRSHWPAYAWVFPLGDGRANVGYGELLQGRAPTRRDLERRLRDLLPAEVGAPASLRGHRLPLSPGRPELACGNVLLAGDAASLINPLTGEGIYYAVLSGSLAGAAAMLAEPGRAYRHAVDSALGGHLHQTDLLARLGRWPSLIDIGVRAARERQFDFDALLEIGLGAGQVGPRTMVGLLRSATRSPGRAIGHASLRRFG